MRRDVRILLVGDDGVGKSSLITTLIKEHFVTRVQKVVPEITLPPEVTPEGVMTKIVDSSPAPEHRARLEAELRRANVICIVYSIAEPASFDRIPTFWLPWIRSLGVNVPVILVGNKIDLRGGVVTNAALEDELAPVMAEYKEVETCVECSARIPLNVSEVFYFAQKAVLHPTAPLYDSREHTLKPACIRALRRIFRLCDVDKDGLLSDAELNDFQRKCFDAPLQLQELEGIKELVLQSPTGGGSRYPYGGDGASVAGSSNSANGEAASPSNHPHLRDGALTLAGFLYLHTLFIQRGRLETTWAVLRTFGYGSDMELREDFVRPRFDVPPDCSVELSPHGYQFLTDVFEAHDKDKDGALCASELESLFATAPGNPWADTGFPDTTITDESGAVTLQGWLAQWSMTTLLDHRTTLAYLAYLGYPSFPLGSNGVGAPTPIPLSPTNSSQRKSGNSGNGPPSTTSALKVTRPRRADRKKGKVQRTVFLAYVLGAAGSGKTALLRAMVGKPLRDEYEPTTRVASVVSAVEHKGAEKYLVLQEFGSRYEAEVLRNAKKLEAADVIVFVYDSADTNSFSYIGNLRQQYRLLESLPSLFVATKADLDLAQQRHEVQPDVYCRKLGLSIPGLGAGPLNLSVRAGQLADCYNVVCAIALEPSGAVPGASDRALSYASSRVRFLIYLGLIVGGGAVIFGVYCVARPGTAGLGLGTSGLWGARTSEGGASAHGGGWLAWLWGGAAGAPKKEL